MVVWMEASAKEEVYSLQAQLTATQSTVIALRKESAHLPGAAAASLIDLTQSYSLKFAALQQIHAAEVVAARQAAQEEASRALAQAVGYEIALASRDTEVAPAQGRLSLEQERKRGESGELPLWRGPRCPPRVWWPPCWRRRPWSRAPP